MTFAHKELDLYKVFWEVQERGGYQAVCGTKQWKVRRLSRKLPLLKQLSGAREIASLW